MGNCHRITQCYALFENEVMDCNLPIISFKTHLPGYVDQANEIRQKGIADIVCVSVNDPFVMAAWGEAHKADGKV